jgi:hypothetical protein
MKAFLRNLWKGREHETKTLALPIREFVYFDREKVEDFVSALLAGLPVERTEGAISKPQEVSGGIGYAGTGIRFKKGRKELTREELIKETDASLFQTLHSILDEKAAIKKIDEFDTQIWDQLEAGQFIEIESNVEFSALESLFDIIRNLEPWLNSFASEQSQAPKWREFFEYLHMLDKQRDTYAICAIPSGAPSGGLTFVASLSKVKMRATKEELANKYSVFGRVQRKLGKNETFELTSLMPKGIQLPGSQLRDLLKGFKDIPPLLGRAPTLNDLRVSYPAVILTPVAIFR